ncbi:gp53-like domain-containing protein [Pseudomonas alvandae]|jgi:hypothetical protein|uniref:gp53-like domain-containing protein n=1 Tax=Pseudomonas canavaninivorans TaxID=2842348 RepID=UPI00215F65BF|nr:hypothetical protein [Pseudomonas canavaninivorans]UVM71381.1 hypothetical protein LOY40_22790 [Pseudomonas canavaninivorans]
MDYPKRVPSVGLVNGKFVDENPVTGAPGSLIPAQWGNAVTEEVLNVITSGGLVPDESNNAQLLAAITTKIASAIPAAPPAASTTGRGVVELATDAETQSGADIERAVTPAGLSARTATVARTGIVQFATQAEAEAGLNATKALNPLGAAQAMAKYGLGSNSVPLLTTVADSTTATGLYQVDATTIGLPIPEAGFIDIRRGGSGLVSQQYYSRSSDRAFFRRGNGSLGTWGELMHTGTVASQAETDAGAADNRFITPKKLRWGFAISLATNGYVVFPSWLGGLVIQWGSVATPTADREYSVTFPLAFPTAVFNVISSFGYNDVRVNDGCVAQTRLVTQTGFFANRQDIAATMSLPNSYIQYLAVGY